MAKKGLNIYRRKDGRWEGRVRIQVSSDGKTRYRSVYGRSYKEAREKVLELIKELDQEQEEKDREKQKKQEEAGRRPDGNGCALTVGEIVDQWLEEKKGAWKESTYACYFQIVERHIRGNIGDRDGETFDSASCSTFLEGLHRKRDGGKISSSYACSIGMVLRQAFRHMSLEHGRVLPVLRAGKAGRGKPVEVPSDQTMEKLMEYLSEHAGDSTCLGVLLACCTGIRIGELCALKWGDIDLETGVLRVRRNMQRIKKWGKEGCSTLVQVQTPKTLSSVRNIPIPAGVLGLLKKHQGGEEAYLVAGKRKAWAEARTVQYRFGALLKACGIGRFRFHMLRHYFASRCVRKGFDVKSLSEILGHANVKVTLGLYVHSTMEQKREQINGVFAMGQT